MQSSFFKPRLAVVFVWLYFALLATTTSGFNHGDKVRRDHEWATITKTVTSATSTSTLKIPFTTTVTTAGRWTSTVVVGDPPYTYTTTTAPCITYSWITFAPRHETQTVTTTSTAYLTTVTATPTYWVPTFTVYVDGPATTVTRTTTYQYPTQTVRQCASTLVIDLIDHPGATFTYSNYAATHTVSGLCLTPVTRSTDIPGVTLPTREAGDDEFFTSGATQATKTSIAPIQELTDTFIQDTTTVTACVSNPTPISTRWTITVTYAEKTTTVPEHLDQLCRTPTYGKPRVTGDALQGRQEVTSVPPTPVRVETVVYTTLTVIDNTVRTLTGTAVVDYFTQSFPKTVATYVQTTILGSTYTVPSYTCLSTSAGL
ncbi:hypothetical protein QBC35DRAFT_32485 [Podospora australis]|uniref:Uncharacterized protein n=1 Tax=Podospora australis TaxID=1536484 RepID=A0AAN6WNA3_9PEZI|nr:hypothetical protein QBC35DRAFT_32485 [Podospora australis]